MNPFEQAALILIVGIILIRFFFPDDPTSKP